MREIRSSGSVEGVLGNHDSYSDYSSASASGAGWMWRTATRIQGCSTVMVAHLERRRGVAGLFGQGRRLFCKRTRTSRAISARAKSGLRPREPGTAAARYAASSPARRGGRSRCGCRSPLRRVLSSPPRARRRIHSGWPRSRGTSRCSSRPFVSPLVGMPLRYAVQEGLTPSAGVGRLAPQHGEKRSGAAAAALDRYRERSEGSFWSRYSTTWSRESSFG